MKDLLSLPLLLLLLVAPTVVAQIELCRNTDWLDEDGCGCDEYDFNPEWCEEFGEFEWEGSSANEACCACGGGRAIFIEGAETDPPVVIGEKNCIFSPPVEVAPGLTVENWVDNDSMMFRMRMTYEGKSWIGLSFENDGRPGKPTFAVIGRQENEDTSSVRKYILNTANPDASGVVRMPQGSQTLEDISFMQTTSKTIMTFTKPLQEIFDIPEQVVELDRVTWIYAVGLPDNQWEGSHTVHGKFNLALNPCFKYPWEITNPTVNGGLVDDNALDRRSFFGEKPYKIMWIAHGISLAIAWGIVAPLALAASFLRKKRASWAKWSQVWNTTLLLLTCAGILLGVIATYMEERAAHMRSEHSYWGVGVFGGLLLYCMMALYFGAVRAQEEKKAQDELERKRNKRVITRVVGGDKKEPDVILGMGDGLEVVPGDSPHNPKNKNKQKSLYSDPTPIPSMADPEPTIQRKPETTFCLEWFSRFLLLACIALAYYTCHSGLVWQFFHYELDWDYYYWGVGAVGALIILLLVPLSCCLKENISTTTSNNNTSAAAAAAKRQAPEAAPGSPAKSGNEQMMFAKGVDEDSYYPGSASTHDDGTYQTTGQMIDEETQLEEQEAQRSPMRASWSMDTCCL